MFGVIGWIIFGLIVGAVAKLLMPGRDPGGFIVTMLLGIAGALVGGFLGRAAGWYGPNDPAGFLMSLLGAVVLPLDQRQSEPSALQTDPREKIEGFENVVEPVSHEDGENVAKADEVSRLQQD